ncbi:hypothetical protein TRFO_05753 [Tritrichomonas foetus]|uniref:Uncharacterized protein n=1 Tax=Tritrichomonas foetus TaxID=1144522 RepID=A0A1J4K2N6_9EUKA|nr:hypothetical protein TRFO_05753 [Tritrichomonas foetus]|eukprot:OHT05655.1 hypothetical protein TRFO_05753 [Tritrichomonas foetus]
MINRHDSDVDDEKARIQFGQTMLQEVDQTSLELATRNIDPNALDNLMENDDPDFGKVTSLKIVKEAPPLLLKPRKKPKINHEKYRSFDDFDRSRNNEIKPNPKDYDKKKYTKRK